MKVSKKAKGLVDYSAIYNPVPEYAEEPQYTDEDERIQQEMIEAQIREREENKKALAIWEEQAKKNLDDILIVPGAIADRLTYLFEVKKIEKAAFARQIGSGRTTIHRYLSGESTPTKKKLLIIIKLI